MTDLWRRLGLIWLRAILPGVALALFLFAGQFGVIVLLGKLTLGFDADLSAIAAIGPLVLFAFAHALFITVLADHLIARAWRLRWRAIGAALILTLPILLIVWIDAAGSSYGCADGEVINRSPVPMWPWAWIGWFVLTLGALPSRLLGHGAHDIEPWPRRVMMLAPFAVIVLVTGLPFQQRSIDCTPPFDGGWGLFEGGVVAIPMLGLFLFSMAFSLAVLSAAFVHPVNEGLVS